MFRRLSKISLVALAIFLVNSSMVFAEGDSVCRGRIIGETDASNPNNVNPGFISFDAHPLPAGAVPGSPAAEPGTSRVSNLGILDGFAPGTNGNAPGEREYAACIEDSTPAEAVFADKTFELQGWAYSDNVGFISMFCDGTQNPEEDHNNNNNGAPDFVTPIACGAQVYGVTIGQESGGTRLLSGFAWNDVLGYIRFDDDNTGDAFNYGVSMDSDGNVSGYAYSEAGVYVNFDGITMELPGASVVVPGGSYCSNAGRRPICFELDPDPRDTAGSVVADAVDGYQIDLYLRNPNGSAIDLTTNDVDLTFVWADTVKPDQRAGTTAAALHTGVATSWAADDRPVNFGGAVMYKPVEVSTSTNFDEVFYEVTPNSGHYRLNAGYTIRSLAPTTNENVSWTTSTEPSLEFNNETFIYDLGLGAVEANVLSSARMEIDLNSVAQQPVYANGSSDLALRFEPVFELSTLYANNLEDSIETTRGLPVTYTANVTEQGSLDHTQFDLQFVLGYSESETVAAGCSVGPAGYADDFEFYFLNNFGGDDISASKLNTLSAISEATASPGGSNDYLEAKDMVMNGFSVDSIAQLAAPEGTCPYIGGPTLYSEIFYTGNPGGKQIYYYSNKLPRLLTATANPSLVVHGNIYAPKAFSPNASQQIQETGTVETSSLKNAIYENVVDNLQDNPDLVNPSLNLQPGAAGAAGGECTITSLPADVESIGIAGGTCNTTEWEAINLGNQRLVYFHDVDVVFDLAGDVASDWTVVNTKGNVFIDSDLHNSVGRRDLAIVNMGPSSGGCTNKGNIYIHPDVKNIQANMYADCSVLPYGGNKANIGGDGIYAWGSLTSRIAALSKQLLIEGSVASFNTIGGADTDQDGFLRTGFGQVFETPVSEANRMKAQAYDLNFLRLFTLEVEKSAAGLPIDQKCQQALTIDEILAIRDWIDGGSIGTGPVIGENGLECNGIDPEQQYNAGTGDGDLVAPQDAASLAEFVDPTDNEYDPVYIFYEPSQSFVFDQE